MPGPNEVLLNSVFSALSVPGIQESHILSGTPFFVVVQADAGSTAFGDGVHYRLHVLLKDLVNNTTVLNSIVTGNFQDANWSTAAKTFQFGATAGAQDTIYQALAVLSVGITNPAVSFLESDPIVIT